MAIACPQGLGSPPHMEDQGQSEASPSCAPGHHSSESFCQAGASPHRALLLQHQWRPQICAVVFFPPATLLVSMETPPSSPMETSLVPPVSYGERNPQGPQSFWVKILHYLVFHENRHAEIPPAPAHYVGAVQAPSWGPILPMQLCGVPQAGSGIPSASVPIDPAFPVSCQSCLAEMLLKGTSSLRGGNLC